MTSGLDGTAGPSPSPSGSCSSMQSIQSMQSLQSNSSLITPLSESDANLITAIVQAFEKSTTRVREPLSVSAVEFWIASITLQVLQQH